MKKRRAGYALAAAALLCLSGPVAAMASTVTLGDPTPAGIGYTWTVSMGGNDTTLGSSPAYTGTVGSLSWNDPSNAGDPIGTGWTHTSNWTALTLTDAANLSVTLAANNSTFVPAFTLWQGQQLIGGDHHVFNNAGNFAWAPDLNYIGNEANLGALSSITKVFSLAAGDYTLNFGGNPPAGTPGAQVGYQATLTTAPVPLPAAVWLFGSGIAGLVGLARRRRAAA
jgi:hypothetical protein